MRNHFFTCGLAAFAGVVVVSAIRPAAADVTWSVIGDQTVDTSQSASVFSIRGIAVSSDGSSVYASFLKTSSANQTTSYSTSTGAQSTTDYNVGTSGPGKGLAIDDRGYLYVAETASSKVQIFNTLSSTPTVAIATVTGLSSVEGVAVQDIGGTYYLYGTSKTTNTVDRWNVGTSITGPAAAPALDSSFGTAGKFAVTSGGNNLTNLHGITVDTAGNIYIASAPTNDTTNSGLVVRISSDLSTVTTTSLPNASDVAFYKGMLYVTQYATTASDIAVFNAGDLSAAGILNPGATYQHTNNVTAGNDDGYSGIDVSPSGQLYVADQLYAVNGNYESDRILVSSTVPEPASLALFAMGSVGLLLKRKRRGA